MKRRVSAMPTLLFIAALMAASGFVSEAADSTGSFKDNFNIMWSENHFTTSGDGQTWYLALDKETGNQIQRFFALVSKAIFVIIIVYIYLYFLIWIGCGFETKQKYRFGWFSMKLKLVGGDSAGVVTAYYVSF